MSFVPFTRVNHHHQQSILLGCALLPDENEEIFVQLSTSLEAMGGDLF